MPPPTRLALILATTATLALLATRPALAQSPVPATFTNFETGPVRPIALSADGARLYALNTADDRLEILDVTSVGLARAGEGPVGLRPVALAVRGDRVWVVNYLSDSVSVVDVSIPARAHVVRTLDVGDEPQDIVIAGPNHDRVFVATARREQLTKPGVGRASVWVFQADDPDAAPTVLSLFGMPARALAATADGRTVYAAIFASGNQTTTIGQDDVNNDGGPPAPVPPNQTGQPAPETGLIVKWNGKQWVDETGRNLSRSVPFTLPDKDVFVIDASASTPTVTGAVTGVGTTLFNMAVQPGTGDVWVTNTEARNQVRFEPNVRGHFVESRITRLHGAGMTLTAQAIALNPHIDYSTSPGPADEIARSLGQPLDIVWQSDGQRAYVAAFLSRKVGILDGSGQVVGRIDVGFGPGGLALDEARSRLYVLNHLDATVSVIDTRTDAVVATMPLHYDPTPAVVKTGRPFLYDAALTSGHGDQACASCHVFADLDHLAWDLGDPTGTPLSIVAGIRHTNPLLTPRHATFHPMKGPMTTQSLRGLLGAGPMHWRGDRYGQGANPREELESFKQFDGAFKSLNGRAEKLSDADMTAFGRFVLTIAYPPNPVQNPDRSRTTTQTAGHDFFLGSVQVDSGASNCVGCHALPFGTNGRVNFEGDQISQDFKAAHFRNDYEKVGRFDSPGDQVSGFGFLHDGSTETVFTFLHNPVFKFPGSAREQDTTRHQLEDMILAFDTGTAPTVGLQITLHAAPTVAQRQRIDLLTRRATAGDCALIAHALDGDMMRGYLFTAGAFRTDRTGEAPRKLDDLLAQAATPGGEVTFTGVPPTDGVRSALDRDGDTFLDGDERAAGSDPADPGSTPGHAVTPTPWPTSTSTESPTPTSSATDTPMPIATVTPSATPAPPVYRVWLPIADCAAP